MSDANTIAFIRDKFASLETNMNRGFDNVTSIIEDHTKSDLLMNEKLDIRITKLEDHKLVSKGKILAYSSMGGSLMTLIGLALEAWIYK